MSNTITFYLTPFWRRKTPQGGIFSWTFNPICIHLSFLPFFSISFIEGLKSKQMKKVQNEKEAVPLKKPFSCWFSSSFQVVEKKLLRRFWSLGIKKPLDNFLLLPSSTSNRHQKFHGCFLGFKILHLYCNSKRARLGFHILNFSFGKHQPHRWSNYCVWFHPTTCWS